MKFTKIALACGLAIAAMSVQAATVPGVSGSTVMFFSGASAPDTFMADVIAGSSGMLSNAITITNTSDANFKAWVGDANGIPGITNGTKITLIKRSKGGSAFGVDPLARSQHIQTLDVASASCVSVSATAYTCPLTGSDPLNATTDGTGVIPDFGVSDVEPAMFKAPYNNENGNPQLSNSELGQLVNAPVNLAVFGPVTTDTVATSTHIGRAQYGAMLAGLISDWSQIDGSSDAVVVCRRPNGSGTQASFNWFYSGFPCNVASNGYAGTPPASAEQSFGWDGNSNGTVANPSIIDPTAGLTIVENNGSGDVRNCLSSAYYGVDHTVQGASGKYYKVLFSAVAGTPVSAVVSATAGAPALVRGGPSKAIGVLSLDSYAKVGTAFSYKPLQTNNTTPYTYTIDNGVTGAKAGWNFRMMDGAGIFDGNTQTASAGATGIAPSKDNLINGRYDFGMELSMQRRTNLAGAKLSFFNNLRTRLGSIAYTGGTLVSTPNAFATLPTISSYDTNPASVSKYSRSGNTCSPLVSFPSL